MESETINNWNVLNTGTYNNGQYDISQSDYIRLLSETKRQFFSDPGSELETITYYSYNNLGLKTSQTSMNSRGLNQKQEIVYAYEQYPYVESDNMLNIPYEIKNSIDGTITSIERTEMKQTSAGKVYPEKSSSKTNNSSFRIISEVTNVDQYGNVLETYDGNGTYTTTLYGYGDKYPVAIIENARFNEVIAQLNVSYNGALQNLDNVNDSLKNELLILYDQLPEDTMVAITLFDEKGHTITEIDNRKEEVHYEYDTFGRVVKTKDRDGNILEEKVYNFGN